MIRAAAEVEEKASFRLMTDIIARRLVVVEEEEEETTQQQQQTDDCPRIIGIMIIINFVFFLRSRTPQDAVPVETVAAAAAAATRKLFVWVVL